METFKQRKCKNNKTSICYESSFKGYESSCIVEILIFFNPELQLKYVESAIKSKIIELLTQLKGFKFVSKLVLLLKKIESQDKIKHGMFYSHSKAEAITNGSDTFRKRFKLD